MNIFMVGVVLILILSGVMVGGWGNFGETNKEVGPQTVRGIYNWHDLHSVRYDLSENYALMNNLTPLCEGYGDYNDPETSGWLPIGDGDNRFTGCLDGKNHTIAGLYIFRTSDHIGLFGFVGAEGQLRNLGVVDLDILGSDSVGGLVGTNYLGTVKNSYSTGSVKGNERVGGLVGWNECGTVDTSYTTGIVSGSAIYTRVGGLVGENNGTIENSYATGSVNGRWFSGGLVGENHGLIESSYANGNVNGTNRVGGLVGQNSRTSTVNRSYAQVIVNAMGGQIGGLVGWNYEGTVENSYASGAILGEGTAGGLLGGSYEGKVKNSYSTGTVTRSSHSTITHFGGFVGWARGGKIINCYSTGGVHYSNDEGPTNKGFVGTLDTSVGYEMTGSLWDMETSGQIDTAGNATGKTTEEMMTISTFTNLGWDIIGVADIGNQDTNHIWNIVDTETYPFLSIKQEIHEPSIYELTISSTDGGRVIEPGEGIFDYSNGTVVDLVAEANTNYHFVVWNGDTDTIDDVYSPTTIIVMTGDCSITANFAINEHVLTISSTYGGSVTTPGGGVFSYDHGTVVDIVAVADTDYHFVEWTGDTDTIDDINSATTTITMAENYVIIANFAINEHDLTISSTLGGSVTTPGEDTYTYDYGTAVDLVATPEMGYHFVRWTGDIDMISNVTSATTTITMHADYEIMAVFSEDIIPEDNFKLMVNIVGSGTVNINPEEDEYEEGTNVILTAIPYEGWTFLKWTGDVPTGAEYTDEITILMDDNKIITAHFEEITQIIQPSIEITSPGQGDTIGTDVVTVEWKSEQGTHPISHYEIKINDGEWNNIGAITSYTYTCLEYGEYTVIVEVIDMGGYNGTSSVTFTIDTLDEAPQDDDDNGGDEFAEMGMLMWMLPLVAIVVVVLALFMVKRGGSVDVLSDKEEDLLEDDQGRSEADEEVHTDFP